MDLVRMLQLTLQGGIEHAELWTQVGLLGPMVLEFGCPCACAGVVHDETIPSWDLKARFSIVRPELVVVVVIKSLQGNTK